jgi:hypothetical protein
MSGILRVRWTLISPTFPEPVVHCSGCGVPKPYRSSGKFRLNAHGKRLDAWLIYRCRDCGTTWNRPLFKRRKVTAIPSALLQALEANDPGLEASVAFHIAPRRPRAADPQSSGQTQVEKQIIGTPCKPWRRAEIRIAVGQATPLRLDRLLAAELKLTRTRLQGLAERKLLYTNHALRRTLRRPVRDETEVTIELAALADGVAVGMAAAGLRDDRA